MKSLLKLSALFALGAGLVIPASAQFGAESRAKGQLTACKSNLKNIGTACEMYATDNAGRYPKKLSELPIKPTPKWSYLKTLPTCPAAGKDTYSQTYQVKAPKLDKNGKIISGKDYIYLHCSGHHHKDAGGAANRPAYNSDKGLIEK